MQSDTYFPHDAYCDPVHPIHPVQHTSRRAWKAWQLRSSTHLSHEQRSAWISVPGRPPPRSTLPEPPLPQNSPILLIPLTKGVANSALEISIQMYILFMYAHRAPTQNRFIQVKHPHTQAIAANAADPQDQSWQKAGPRITRIATNARSKFQFLSVPIRVIRGSLPLASRQESCSPVGPKRVRGQSPAHS